MFLVWEGRDFDSAQVLIPIIVQETTPVIENIVSMIVDDIVQEQNNNEVFPQIPIQQLNNLKKCH